MKKEVIEIKLNIYMQRHCKSHFFSESNYPSISLEEFMQECQWQHALAFAGE